MSYVYESNMALGLNGGVSSGFGPIRTSMTNSESKLRHFHPFNGYRLDCQRSFYERNEAANCLSRYGAGNNVASATVPESYLPGNGVYLANALYRHYLFPFNAGTLDTGYKHESSIRTLQNLCDPAAETGTSCRVSSSVDRKDQSHPFYCRKRVEPVEGMTRTRDKYRVVYTEKQRKGLENEYKTNKFITTERRAKLCEELNLSERQIKIWFQNRRAKERRDSKVEKGTEKTDSGNKSGDENNIDRMCSLNLAHADFSTSCRFAGNNVQLEERTVRHSQCRFMNQSTFCAINSNTSAALDALPFKSHDSGVMRHSVSPSDWSTSVANNFIPSLEVSPLTGNLNVEFEPRL